jgi:hypothetical protein
VLHARGEPGIAQPGFDFSRKITCGRHAC